jgi:cytochrome c-type biogenesis protein CcmE
MNNYWKFGLLMAAIIGVLVWLSIGGISQAGTYYKPIKELNAMDGHGMEKRLRVGGDIAPNSITRDGRMVKFTLVQDDARLNVVYEGIDPLPDTFKDGALALADGKLGTDHVFHASKIQAKCASKYEQKPTTAKPVGAHATT